MVALRRREALMMILSSIALEDALPSGDQPELSSDLKIPEFCEPLPAARKSDEMLERLWSRRSSSAAMLGEPGPDERTLRRILTIAARVPDHRKVVPFRFLLIEGDARGRAGDILAGAFEANEPDASPEKVKLEQGRFERAPVVVAVISAVDVNHRTPEWEQVLCAGAVCQNMLLGAHACGFAAQWLTEWYAFDRQVLDGLGLAAHEKIAGFIYIGTASEDPKERQRPVLNDIVCRF